MYDDHIKDYITYMTGYSDVKSFNISVNEQTTRSKFSMAAGCLILEGYQYENEDDIFISRTHAEQLKSLSKAMLAKVWHISEYKARRKL